MPALFIAGSNGRIGRELARLAGSAGLPVVDTREEADVCLLALPRQVVELQRATWTTTGGPAVIDLSGAFKDHGLGTYALMRDAARLFSGAGLRGQTLFANPGCIASGVILGLERSGLRPFLTGGVHVTALTSGSAAHRSQSGTARAARRRWTHPHRAEIERALPGVHCATFTPLIDYRLERGILASISGTARPGALSLAKGADELEVADVVGTDEVRWQLEVGERAGPGVCFTLLVALDNLTFPAANAIALTRRWLEEGRGP